VTSPPFVQSWPLRSPPPNTATAARVSRFGGLGHVLFSCLQQPLQCVTLAPVAVLPAHLGTGVGSALIKQGLAELEQDGHCLVAFVVGAPKYYQRFGFSVDAAARFETEYQRRSSWPGSCPQEDLTAAPARVWSLQKRSPALLRARRPIDAAGHLSLCINSTPLYVCVANWCVCLRERSTHTEIVRNESVPHRQPARHPQCPHTPFCHRPVWPPTA